MLLTTRQANNLTRAGRSIASARRDIDDLREQLETSIEGLPEEEVLAAHAWSQLLNALATQLGGWGSTNRFIDKEPMCSIEGAEE